MCVFSIAVRGGLLFSRRVATSNPSPDCIRPNLDWTQSKVGLDPTQRGRGWVAAGPSISILLYTVSPNDIWTR